MARLRLHYLWTDLKNILKFDSRVFIDVDYRITKAFLKCVYNLINLFTAQNRLELGPQLPIATEYKENNKL